MLEKEREKERETNMFGCMHTCVSGFTPAFHRHTQTCGGVLLSPEKDSFSGDSHNTEAD